jgi:hypothetical protein
MNGLIIAILLLFGISVIIVSLVGGGEEKGKEAKPPGETKSSPLPPGENKKPLFGEVKRPLFGEELHYRQGNDFEEYVVGMTAAEVQNIKTQDISGRFIAVDDALLSAGCTIQITEFISAVVKACNDEQGMSFNAPSDFTLGVAANSTVDSATKAATADAAGVVAMYTDFAASVVVDGKIAASINDATQPRISFDIEGNIIETSFKATKRELKESYYMSAYGTDNNGDGIVREWYLQSEAFSEHVVGMTADEVANMATLANDYGYIISADDDLLSAGCTIQITGIKAVVAKSADYAY